MGTWEEKTRTAIVQGPSYEGNAGALLGRYPVGVFCPDEGVAHLRMNRPPCALVTYGIGQTLRALYLQRLPPMGINFKIGPRRLRLPCEAPLKEILFLLMTKRDVINSQ